MTDCTFPLARVAPLDPWGPHVADEDVTYDDQNDEQADCIVEGSALVCRDVMAYYTDGERLVTPWISGQAASVTATFDAVDGADYPLQLIPASGVEPYVFGYSPLRVWAYGPAAMTPGLARVWLRDDPSYSWTVVLPATTADMVDPLEIDVGGLTPGRYRLTPCFGDTAESCEEVPGGITFQVGTGKIEELMPGWNRRDADRINVVFAASGNVTIADAREAARALVAWDGPLLVGNDDTLLPATASFAEVWTLEFGPFAIEPLRSARDHFNLWFLDDVVDDSRALEYSAPPYGSLAPPDFGLPDTQVTVLDFLQAGRWGRSEAGLPSFTSPDGPTVVSRDGLQFAGVYLALPTGLTLAQAEILAHEWGHALFDLRDEYQEPSRGVTHGYPNCAPDQVTAEAWWGDQVGEVDPFVYEYAEVRLRWSQWEDPDLVSRITIGYHPGGCYSDHEADAIRPTEDSIMNSGVPVFGAVNRRRVEEILSLWTGLSPLGADHVSASCDPVGSVEHLAVCRLSVGTYVDVPNGGLVAGSGEKTVGCEIVSGIPPETIDLACGALPLVGPGPWDVVFTDRTGARIDQITLSAPEAPPPEPPTVPSTTVPLVPPVPSDSHVGAWLLIGALVTVIVSSAAVLIRRRLGLASSPTPEA